MDSTTYENIGNYRKSHILQVSHDHFQLNKLHHQILTKVLETAIKQVSIRYGPPPSPFSFFVMGSAGRQEQSIWSDQDHGIVYQNLSVEGRSYFLTLGKEISKGLYQAGYPYCDGGIMAGNPFWCKSITEWQEQLANWTLEASWESIRYLLIFLDARSVYGEDEYVSVLKHQIYQTVNKKHLHTKLLNNTLHLKKGINVLGQLLVETHGPHTGSLNLKELGFLPYVNAVRLAAIKKNVLETSTLSRLEKIHATWLSAKEREFYIDQFSRLLNYRLLFCHSSDYDSGHYLPINRLSKDQTKEIKEIIKSGATLYHTVRKLLEKEEYYGDE
jgi:CBS domain-containing protein